MASAVERLISLAIRRHDDAYRYALPYRIGECYIVSQGYGGALSHTREAHYSLDFSMRERTVVRAAREGRVTQVEDHHRVGGPDKALAEQSNHIQIEHPDGTEAVYAHLSLEGSYVSVGDLVERGEAIGLSGNTGWSTGPHLHFHVRTVTGELIPVVFPTRDGDRETLVEGRAYSHPGSGFFLIEWWTRLRSEIASLLSARAK